MRQTLLVIHRWASLITGAFLLVLAITGSMLSFEDPRSPMRTVRLIHTHLLVGDFGEFLVGTTTVAALLVVIIGIILWWPDKIWRVRASASWKRINFELHHLLGIATSLVLIVMLASAVVVQATDEDEDKDKSGAEQAQALERRPGAENAGHLPHDVALNLHTGAFGGTPTTIIWFVSSLALAGQAVTGFVMWWNARAARNAGRSTVPQ